MFNDCRELKEVIFLDSVNVISTYSFKNCVRLAEIYLGRGVTDIESLSFYACQNIENIYYAGTTADLDYIICKDLGGMTVKCEHPQPTYDIATRYE